MKPFFFIVGFVAILISSSSAQPVVHAVADFSSSDLPIIVLNTHGIPIVDEPKISADMGIIYNGEGVRNEWKDPFNHYHGRIAIEIRGSSSQQFEKKQYGFSTVDSAGGDYDVPLLGFPSEHTWILSAQYNDKTLMRDALTFNLSNKLGRYASRTKYCEVFINGDYRGVYLLMEKVKRGKNRVNISKMTAVDTTGDNLTGGYIYKIDKADKLTDKGWDAMYPPFGGPYRRNLMYQYEYPDPEEITTQQMNYLQTFEKNFEMLMASATYRDSVTGYPAALDVTSFVDMVLMNEFTRNVDSYRLSTFLYKDRTSKSTKLVAGPLWDCNLGYGNCNYNNASYRSGWEIENQTSAGYTDAFKPPFWWKKLWDDQIFKKTAALRWQELRQVLLSTKNIIKLVDSLEAVVNEGQQRNFVRWPIIGTYVWPNNYIGASYTDEINYLKGWVINRSEWMDNAFAQFLTSVRKIPDVVPLRDALEQNFPNPFNPTTSLRFTTTHAQHVKLVVYDVLGRQIALLVDDVKPAGSYAMEWNAAGLPSGMYYCRMQAGASTSTIRMIVAK
jgi:hypothetical protein